MTIIFLNNVAATNVPLEFRKKKRKSNSNSHVYAAQRKILLTQIIFLSDVPATNRCCLLLSGWNLTQNGILREVNLCTTSPVSVSHNLMYRSYPADTNCVPLLLKPISLTACRCPKYVRIQRRSL